MTVRMRSSAAWRPEPTGLPSEADLSFRQALWQRERFYAAADTAAGGLMGAVMAWAVDLAIPSGSSMWLAMGLSMLVTTLVQIAVGVALGIFLGQLEMMIPAMVLSTLPGMGLGMLKWAGLAGSRLYLVGLFSGLLTFGLFAGVNLWIRNGNQGKVDQP